MSLLAAPDRRLLEVDSSWETLKGTGAGGQGNVIGPAESVFYSHAKCLVIVSEEIQWVRSEDRGDMIMVLTQFYVPADPCIY